MNITSCILLHSTGYILISKKTPKVTEQRRNLLESPFFWSVPLHFFPSHIDFLTTLRSGKMPPTRTQGCKHCFVSLPRYGKKEGLRKETESPAYTQTHKINADQCFISLRRSYSRPESPEGKKNTSHSPLV